MIGYPAGPGNALTDVSGLRIGHHERTDGGYLSGTTVILAPDDGMVAGVDVRGGAPGTRETDLLHPTASPRLINAIVLTGGSAFGLSAASGVTDALAARGVGFAVGPPGAVVPIVPGAVLFDLGRGGDFTKRPGPEFGLGAVTAALRNGPDTRMGPVGAGSGAVTAGIKGGVGTASAVTPDGIVVAALVVANAVGCPVDPRNGELLGARNLRPEDFPGLRIPTTADRDALLHAVMNTGPHLRTPGGPAPSPVQNTSIGIIATNATLTRAQCTKMAGTAHDGLARALNPVHTQFDGDTLFAVSTGAAPVPDEIGLHHILCAAADVVTRALVRGLLAAQSVTTGGGSWSSYLDLAPSARGG
ncbi:putative pantetheine hydrolase [Nakamurella sp. UYEF19]|uniref:P1 family peptidase n=1 Tax=Nakamurella sp. UYEF19 TaxID=1756392 RepID=UPI003398C003